jgi:toxin ParE1/3/4
MANYLLTEQADEDLANVLRRGALDFGLQKAEEYYDGLVDRLNNISERPMMYQAVDEIKPGSRRSVYNVHSIYFQIRHTEVLIIRILGRQDPITAIKKVN